jgi:DNA polymerase-1
VSDAVVEALRDAGVGRGDLVALALAPGVGLGMVVPRPDGLRQAFALATDDPAAVVAGIDEALRPRWVMWTKDTAATLVRAGVRVATCWDVAAVHRLLFGGWHDRPARAWALVHGLAPSTIPADGPLDLFSQAGDAAAAGSDPDGPIRADGHLSPEWTGGGWATSPERLARWAELAAQVAERQQALLAVLSGAAGTRGPADAPSAAGAADRQQVGDTGPATAEPPGGPDVDGVVLPVAGEVRPRVVATVRSESAAELLCAELEVDGLPVDREVAEAIIAGFAGPRPRSEADAARERARRDDEVLRHAPAGSRFDLRSPGQVKSLLRRVGIEVPDTRAWRLEGLRDAHPLVEALLAWRKAERVATTYGYGWLDEHLGDDGRLRGSWSGSDGAAGRMTASAGLHNMPADMRAAVVAEPGHVFVRADLGQIEPRVLAGVAGDRALAAAADADDMYAPVAEQLGVDRATAKVAVLGAMYGQTTGHGAQVLPRLHSAYPVAMAYLDAGDRAGQAGRDLRTFGGRRVRMGSDSGNLDELGEREARGRAAARGRYGRNALVQGAAAELFKIWAVTVRARGAALDARIVLCLHDELLVHVPEADGEAAATLVADCLDETAHRWSPTIPVRLVADLSLIPTWSAAKE